MYNNSGKPSPPPKKNDPTMQTAYASMPVKPRDVTGDTEQEEEMPVQKEKEALEEDKEKNVESSCKQVAKMLEKMRNHSI